MSLMDAFGPVVMNVQERIDCLGWAVASQLVRSGRVSPEMTERHVLTDMVDESVMALMPEMTDMIGNERYSRVLTRLVGKSAFTHIDMFGADTFR